MTVDVERIVAGMRAFPEALRGALLGVPPADLRRRPAPEAWSLMEIVGHVLDEETRDFRARVAHVLARPGTPFVPIDPERWVVEREYNAWDLEPTLAAFARERADSLCFLATIAPADHGRSAEHPRAGPLRVADLLAAWHAHDLFHLRQVGRTRVRLYVQAMPGLKLEYAGNL
jgi:hypothetical protein